MLNYSISNGTQKKPQMQINSDEIGAASECEGGVCVCVCVCVCMCVCARVCVCAGEKRAHYGDAFLQLETLIFQAALSPPPRLGREGCHGATWHQPTALAASKKKTWLKLNPRPILQEF